MLKIFNDHFDSQKISRYEIKTLLKTYLRFSQKLVLAVYEIVKNAFIH